MGMFALEKPGYLTLHGHQDVAPSSPLQSNAALQLWNSPLRTAFRQEPAKAMAPPRKGLPLEAARHYGVIQNSRQKQCLSATSVLQVIGPAWQDWDPSE